MNQKLQNFIPLLVIVNAFIFNPCIAQVNAKYHILIETDNNCNFEPLNLEDDLIWYGIYKSDSGEYIQRISVTFDERPLDSTTYVSMVGEHFFWTDKTEKSEWIIGTKSPIEPHKVSRHGYPRSSFGFFYPGQTKTVYTINRLPQRKSYELNAIGTVSEMGRCPDFKDYTLRLSDKYDKWKSQNLSKDIDFMGECNMVELIWFGDIDFDGSPDLLFSGSSNSRNQYNLFLSSEAEDNEFVKLVARFELGNCY